MSFLSPHCRLSGKTGNWITAGVLAGAGTLVVLHFNNAASASVGCAQAPQAVAAQQVIENYLNTEQGGFSDLRSAMRDTDSLLAQSLADRSTTQIPLASLRGDPFRASAGLPSTSGGEQQSDTQRVAMLQDLQKLQLQSIAAGGDNPQCIIGDQLYHTGEQVGDFTIERIDAAVVVVRSGVYRFELKIGG